MLQFARESRASVVASIPSAVGAAGPGSKHLRSVSASTVARAAEAPAVARSTAAIHLLGELSPEERDAPHQRPVAGPRIVSVDHKRDKSQQSTTINPCAESGISRQTPCKPIEIVLRSDRFTRERSLVRAQPCPSSSSSPSFRTAPAGWPVIGPIDRRCDGRARPDPSESGPSFRSNHRQSMDSERS